jgi:hypothetical protein
MSRKAREKVVGAGLGQMSPVIKEWSSLIVEDVDSDGEDGDVIFEDELMLFIGPGDNGSCRNEVVKILLAEQKERQQERIARVRQWQQTSLK